MNDADARVLHGLFERECEGRIVDPCETHAMFMSDAVNDRMDRMLRAKPPPPSLLLRLLKRIFGR